MPFKKSKKFIGMKSKSISLIETLILFYFVSKAIFRHLKHFRNVKTWWMCCDRLCFKWLLSGVTFTIKSQIDFLIVPTDFVWNEISSKWMVFLWRLFLEVSIITIDFSERLLKICKGILIKSKNLNCVPLTETIHCIICGS